MSKVSISAQQLAVANRLAHDITTAVNATSVYYLAAMEGYRSTDQSGIRAGSGEPVNVNAIDARKNAYDDLHFWCRFILDQVNEGTITTVVRPEVPELAAFIVRWTIPLVDQWPDDAANLRKEARRHAHTLRMLSMGWTIRKVEVGRCPEQNLVTVPGGDGQPVETLTPCDGTLWAVLRSEDALLPQHVMCDANREHQWQPWQWPALGRRIGQSVA